MTAAGFESSRRVLEDGLRALGWGVGGGGRALAEPPPALAVVTGSGLGGIADAMESEAVIPFRDLPVLNPAGSAAAVAGHPLEWRIGKLGGEPAHVICGRRHLYEGIGPEQTAAAVRLAERVGARLVVFTNAAGGLSRRLWPGDLMILRDQINLMFRNPLIGPNEWPESSRPGPRFPDMCECFDPAAVAMLRRAAAEAGIAVGEGVYAAVAGPNYETRAEVEMLRRLGADAVGMSTAPEVIAARQAGLRVAAISLITNSHVNRGDAPESTGIKTSHEEVLAEGRRGAERVARLLAAAAPRLGRLARAAPGARAG